MYMALDTFIFVFVDLKATTRIKLATAGLGGTIFIRFQVSSSNFGLKRTTEKHCRIIIFVNGTIAEFILLKA